jgi:hypothetical protein
MQQRGGIRVESLHAFINMSLTHEVQYALLHDRQGLMTFCEYMGLFSFGS